jgi:hypothetical protein
MMLGLLERTRPVEQNNAMLQAVHEDLSEKSSVKSIIEYMVQSNKSQLEKWDNIKDNYPNAVEPPLAEVMIGCGCDSQLVHQKQTAR